MNKYKIFFLIAFLFSGIGGFAQCKDYLIEKSKNLSGTEKVGLYASLRMIDTNTAEITLNNNSDKKLFLFSSYLKDEYFDSRFLNRVNRRTKEIKRSFLPLTPYLSSIKNGKILTDDLKLINGGSINYEFVKIDAHKSYVFKIRVNLPNLLTKDFNTKKVLNGNINWKKKKLNNKQKKKYLRLLEFAIYDEIDELCLKPDDAVTFGYYLKASNFTVFSLNWGSR